MDDVIACPQYNYYCRSWPKLFKNKCILFFLSFQQEKSAIMSLREVEGDRYRKNLRSFEILLASFVDMKLTHGHESPGIKTKGLNTSKLASASPVESSVDPLDERQQEVLQALGGVEVPEGRVPNGLIIPTSLPPNLRSNPAVVEQSDISQLYDLQSTVQCVRDGNLERAEVIALYMRGVKNMVLYELSDVQQLRRRFLRFFANIFMDLVELCYPDRGDSSLVRVCTC